MRRWKTYDSNREMSLDNDSTNFSHKGRKINRTSGPGKGFGKGVNAMLGSAGACSCGSRLVRIIDKMRWESCGCHTKQCERLTGATGASLLRSSPRSRAASRNCIYLHSLRRARCIGRVSKDTIALGAYLFQAWFGGPGHTLHFCSKATKACMVPPRASISSA